MLILDTTTIKLQAVLSAPVTTTELDIAVGYGDQTASSYTKGRHLAHTTGTTAADIMSAPAAGAMRNGEFISARNRDTAQASITFRFNDNGTIYELWRVTLEPNETFGFTHSAGPYCNDVNGNRKSGAVQDLSPYLTILIAATTYQPLHAALTQISGLSPSNDDVIQRKAGAWTNRTPAQLKTDLALVKADVGLGAVDNTSDANKPVSTAQQTALNLKANLASPALTGTPTAPTAADGTNTTQLATTQFATTAVANAIAALVASSPAALDTLKELADAIGDDANFAATTATALGNRLRVDTAAQALSGTQQANALTNLGFSANAQSLVGAANYAAMRGLLGLGTAALAATGDFDAAGAAAAALVTAEAYTDTGIATRVPTSRTVNGHALSSNVTVTASDVGLGSVTNDAQTKAAVVPNTAPSAGQLLVGNAGGTAYAPVAMSGDVTINSSGVTAIGAGKVTEAMQVLADNTTNNASTSNHGYLKKLSNAAGDFMNGVGNWVAAAALATANTFSAAQRGAFVALTDASTIALDLSLANQYRVTLGGSRTLGVPTNIVEGQQGVIIARQDATGSRTLAYAWPYEWAGGTAGVLSTAGCSRDMLAYSVDAYNSATATITIAAPGVVTMAGHGFSTGQRCQITTTGALPTGLATGTTYFISVVDANSFKLCTTLANAAAGTFITTTGSQSGTHTLTGCSISLSIAKAFA